MSKHVADIPKPFYAYVRNEFLYNQEHGHGSYTPALIYGLSSLPSRAWGLSALLDNGGLVQHLPVSAISFTETPEHIHPLDHLQIWSCYGWEFTTHIYDALAEMPVRVYMKGEWENGRYLFTAAPFNDMYSDTPDQHKHFNFIQMDCGALVASPGNRLLFHDSSFTETLSERPKYITNTHRWYVEDIDNESPFDGQISPETSL